MFVPLFQSCTREYCYASSDHRERLHFPKFYSYLQWNRRNLWTLPFERGRWGCHLHSSAGPVLSRPLGCLLMHHRWSKVRCIYFQEYSFRVLGGESLILHITRSVSQLMFSKSTFRTSWMHAARFRGTNGQITRAWMLKQIETGWMLSCIYENNVLCKKKRYGVYV